jgi:hypothetical protein
MTKLTLLGAAVIVASATLAAPAIAQHRVAHPAYNAYTERAWCPNREPGNPYTKEEDYMAWSAWRARGGWDDRNDFNCTPARVHHGAMGF